MVHVKVDAALLTLPGRTEPVPGPKTVVSQQHQGAATWNLCCPHWLKALVATQHPAFLHLGRIQLQPDKGRMLLAPRVRAKTAYGLQPDQSTWLPCSTSIPAGPPQQSRIWIKLSEIPEIHSAIQRQRKWEWWTSAEVTHNDLLGVFCSWPMPGQRTHLPEREQRQFGRTSPFSWFLSS